MRFTVGVALAVFLFQSAAVGGVSAGESDGPADALYFVQFHHPGAEHEPDLPGGRFEAACENPADDAEVRAIDKVKEALGVSDCSAAAAKLGELKELELHSYGLNNLDFLTGAHNLEKLQVGNNNITDLKFLRGMKKLTNLGLANNEMTDLSPLAQLQNLEWLQLWGAKTVTDISPLAVLEHLRTLGMNDTPLGNELVDKTDQNCPKDAKSEVMRRFCKKTRKRHFPYYCTGEKVLDEAVRTVGIVKKMMGTDDCSQVWQMLKTRASLDLVQHSLKDVTPLNNLAVLQNLKLWGDKPYPIIVILRPYETARIEELGLRITGISEKLTADGGQMMVTVELTLPGKKTTVRVYSDEPGKVWEGFRIKHKAGWRSDAKLEVTKEAAN